MIFGRGRVQNHGDSGYQNSKESSSFGVTGDQKGGGFGASQTHVA